MSTSSANSPADGSTNSCPLPRQSLQLVRPGFSALQVQNLTVAYRQHLALENVTVDILPGQVTGLIGPNGAGKSTLIKALLGLVPAAQGQVIYDGKPLTQQRQRVAYVPQRSQIDWQYPATVWDVVMMGRVQATGWLRRFSAASRQRARACLEQVGMGAYCDRTIGELSGGQQQRVFLARALAQGADLFCFDEPFVGVDQTTEAILFELFGQLADAGKTVLVVNHDLGESIQNFDHLILLNRTIVASGPRSQVLTPTNLNRAYGSTVQFHAA